MQFPGRRAPVIVISCPSCGAKVKGAREGQHTSCQYCRTELFVPQIGVPPPPHERHVPEAVVQRREASAAANIVMLAILIVVVSGVGVTFWFIYQVTKPVHTFTVSTPAQPAPVAVPQPTVTPNPGTTAPGSGMARANCLMGCMSKCGDPNTDHTAYAACAQGCTKSCE